jgi:hypothetical protein
MMQTPPPEEDAYDKIDGGNLNSLQGTKSDRYIDDEYVEHQSTMSKQITRTNYNSPTSSLSGGGHAAINFIENARTAFLASAMKISSVKSPPQASF